MGCISNCCKKNGKPTNSAYSPQLNNTQTNLINGNKHVNIQNNIKSFDKYYITGTLQCLLYTWQLTKYFSSKYKENEAQIISYNYYKIIKNIWSEDIPFSPQNFKTAGLKLYNELEKETDINKDCKKLIEYLLEKIHKELNYININEITQEEITDYIDKDEAYKTFFNTFKKNNNSIISDLFYGIYEIKNECNICKTTTYNYELFRFIELKLEKKVPLRFLNQNKGIPKEVNINLIECFDFNKSDYYISGESKNNCLCDNKIKEIIKNLFSMPKYLIIILNRVDNNEYKINYPEKLDLTNYLLNNEYIQIFDLYAVIPLNNQGYNETNITSYCKHPKSKKWYKYNENVVVECEEYESLYTNPNVLFYESSQNENEIYN